MVVIKFGTNDVGKYKHEGLEVQFSILCKKMNCRTIFSDLPPELARQIAALFQGMNAMVISEGSV